MSRLADALTARIAAAKRRLQAGGLLRPIEWLRRDGPRDNRGRKAVTSTMLDALIEQMPSLDRTSGFVTERNDATVVTILDPLAITDSDTLRWGGHIYSIKAIDGVVQDESTGTRYASVVVVIR